MTILRVNSTNHQSGSGKVTSFSLTVPAVGTGNQGYVTLGFVDGADDSNPWTVIDNAAGSPNVYQAVDRALAPAPAHFWINTFFCGNILGNPTQLTAAPADSQYEFIGLMLDEFSGASANLDGHSVFLQDAIANPVPGTGANAVTSGTGVVTTAAGDLIVGSTINIDDNGNITVGTGFSQGFNDNVYCSEWLVQSAAGSTAATFTAGNALDRYLTAMIAVKSATVTTPPLMGQIWI